MENGNPAITQEYRCVSYTAVYSQYGNLIYSDYIFMLCVFVVTDQRERMIFVFLEPRDPGT